MPQARCAVVCGTEGHCPSRFDTWRHALSGRATVNAAAQREIARNDEKTFCCNISACFTTYRVWGIKADWLPNSYGNTYVDSKSASFANSVRYHNLNALPH